MWRLSLARIGGEGAEAKQTIISTYYILLDADAEPLNANSTLTLTVKSPNVLVFYAHPKVRCCYHIKGSYYI